MGRILFFILLAGLVYWFFKSWQRKQDQPDPVEDRKQSSLGKKEKESIMPCKHCGAYSPMDSGVMLEGRFYCNLEHARAEGEKVG